MSLQNPKQALILKTSIGTGMDDQDDTPKRKVPHQIIPQQKDFQKQLSQKQSQEFDANSADNFSSEQQIQSQIQSVQQSNNPIKVFIRARPLLPNEQSDRNCVIINEIENSLTIKQDGYDINQIYDKAIGQESSQVQVFEEFKSSIEKVLEGYNFTIFAYGQTGSGKTYTMFGCDWENSIYSQDKLSILNHKKISLTGLLNEKQQNNQQQTIFFEQLEQDTNYAGIIPRTIYSLFDSLQSKQSNQNESTTRVSIYCSFLQIYNEKIYDLLNETNILKPLSIHESKLDGIFVEGLSEYEVRNYQDTLQLMKRGEKNRTIRQTSMNAKSSRSHTIFQLIIETVQQDPKHKDNGTIKRARINMCDLAGSEKINKNESIGGEHFNELRNINLSLTTLGKVINSLSSNTSKNKLPVPFRESKLTRILQDSLVGNTITYIVANISPSSSNIDETMNTLKFAERARHISMTIKPNQISSKSDENVKKLQREVIYLKELLNLRRKGYTNLNGNNDIHTQYLKLQQENEELKRHQISIKEVEKLVKENRKMKAEIQQIYMGQTTQNTQNTQPDEQTNKPNVNGSFDEINNANEYNLNSPLFSSTQSQQKQSNSPVFSSQGSNLTNPYALEQQISQKKHLFYLGSSANNTSSPNFVQSNIQKELNKSKSSEKMNGGYKSQLFPNIFNYGSGSSSSQRNMNGSPAINRSVHSQKNESFSQNFLNNNGTNSQPNFSNLPSQRARLAGSDTFSVNTPVKIRIRGKQQYQTKDGYIECSDYQIEQQDKEKREKKRILDRLEQIERIQKYNQDKLKKELSVINIIEKQSFHKKYFSTSINSQPNSINSLSSPPSKQLSSFSDSQRQSVGEVILTKQKKQLKDYEDKIKQLERKYFIKSNQ